MKIIAIVILLVSCVCTGFAQGKTVKVPRYYTSQSGQFIVQQIRATPSTNSRPKAIRVEMAGAWADVLVQPDSDVPSADKIQKLDPAILPTTCERIKSAILHELDLKDRWRNRIVVNIDSSMKENTEPMVIAIREHESFLYEVRTPESIKLRRLSRALVHVLLLEMANRQAVDESTHIPFWLVEGMMAYIKADSLPTMLLQLNQRTPVDVSLISLDSVRSELKSQTALTFQELSWPRPEQYSGKGEESYRASAELFVAELIHLRDGRARLARFVCELPRNLNWQVGFIRAFSPDFAQLRDVEKWWGVERLSFDGESLAAQWSGIESGKRFRMALEVPVNVHFATNRMPASAILRVQDVILQWKPEDQRVVLQRVFATLHGLRMHLSPEYQPLLDEYVDVIGVYLNRHTPSYFRWIRSDSNSTRFRNATARKLARLDDQLSLIQGRVAASDLLKQASNIRGSSKNPGGANLPKP